MKVLELIAPIALKLVLLKNNKNNLYINYIISTFYNIFRYLFYKYQIKNNIIIIFPNKQIKYMVIFPKSCYDIIILLYFL